MSNPSSSTQTGEHASFFRQSGWLMIANVAAGALMWAVHFLAKAIPEGEYGDFGAFLAVAMVLPTIPLQMVMAQRTARALATNGVGELSGIIRMFWRWTTVVWIVGAAAVLFFQRPLLDAWKVHNPAGLYLTLLVVLLSIWSPMLWGVLQGAQNFLWLGWSMLASGIGRFSVAAVAVLVFHAYASGMLIGVVLGIAVAVVLGAWHTRKYWLAKPEPFNQRAMVRQITPLLLAFLGFQILFTADTMVVKAFFSDQEAGFYVGAGTLSRALMWLVLPLAAVMFPRLVHSSAKAQKSNLMVLVLAGTAALAIVGATSLAILGPWVVRIVYKESFVEVATGLLPWYAGAMVPLAVANVLLNSLMAKPTVKLVTGVSILAVAVVYLVGLWNFHGSLVTILKVMAGANTLLLVVCGLFTWLEQGEIRSSAGPAA